ncbi:MAG: hypothetical protein PVI57_18135 [Gemmatimonadota bacterium]|jgi:hypothetical protein
MSSPQILPDGSGVVVHRPVAGGENNEAEDPPETRAIVVLNWFQELRALMEGR